MKTVIALLTYLSLTSVALAGQFVQMPNGQLLFTPQAADDPGTHYYQNLQQGGDYVGYSVSTGIGNQAIYHPFNGSSSYVIGNDE